MAHDEDAEIASDAGSVVASEDKRDDVSVSYVSMLTLFH